MLPRVVAIICYNLFMKQFEAGRSSNFKSRAEWERALWRDFLRKAGFHKKAKALLNSILTENEKKLIIKRLVAVSLLRKGKTYREIGEILWLSPSTISSIKKGLKSGRIYRSRSQKDKRDKSKNTRKKSVGKIEDWLIEFVDYLDYWLSVMPPISGRGRWRFLGPR